MHRARRPPRRNGDNASTTARVDILARTPASTRPPSRPRHSAFSSSASRPRRPRRLAARARCQDWQPRACCSPSDARADKLGSRAVCARVGRAFLGPTRCVSASGVAALRRPSGPTMARGAREPAGHRAALADEEGAETAAEERAEAEVWDDEMLMPPCTFTALSAFVSSGALGFAMGFGARLPAVGQARRMRLGRERRDQPPRRAPRDATGGRFSASAFRRGRRVWSQRLDGEMNEARGRGRRRRCRRRFGRRPTAPFFLAPLPRVPCRAGGYWFKHRAQGAFVASLRESMLSGLSWGAMAGAFSGASCFAMRVRRKADAINGLVAGCAAGAALGAGGGLPSALQSCASVGAVTYFVEGVLPKVARGLGGDASGSSARPGALNSLPPGIESPPSGAFPAGGLPPPSSDGSQAPLQPYRKPRFAPHAVPIKVRGKRSRLMPPRPPTARIAQVALETAGGPRDAQPIDAFAFPASHPLGDVLATQRASTAAGSQTSAVASARLSRALLDAARSADELDLSAAPLLPSKKKSSPFSLTRAASSLLLLPSHALGAFAPCSQPGRRGCRA